MKTQRKRKPRGKNIYKWSDTPQRPKTSTRRVADQNILPKLKRHNDYDYIDPSRYRPKDGPSDNWADIRETIRLYGYNVGVHFIGGALEKEWPKEFSLSNRFQMITGFHYNFELQRGGLLHGSYDVRLPARMAERGNIRPNMLSPGTQFRLSHIDPKYCVGTTERGESFNDRCYEFTQLIYPTYSFSMSVPKGANIKTHNNALSVYHGIQHAWYYKPDSERDRAWTLGFNNLPIAEFSVARSQKQIRSKKADKTIPNWYESQEYKDLKNTPDDSSISFGKGIRYLHSITTDSHGYLTDWECIEVVRFFWYGTEINITEYTRRSLTRSQLKLFRNVTSKDLIALILSYGREDSEELSEM